MITMRGTAQGRNVYLEKGSLCDSHIEGLLAQVAWRSRFDMLGSPVSGILSCSPLLTRQDTSALAKSGSTSQAEMVCHSLD